MSAYSEREEQFISAIIVAGGAGLRMGSPVPKQYMPLHGKPILAHTVDIFQQCPRVSEIILVVPESDTQKTINEIVPTYIYPKVTGVIPGGRQRHESVYRGLLKTNQNSDLIIVHDGVRPFVRQEELDQVIDAANLYGVSTLAIPVKETVKECQNNTSVRTLDRSNMWIIQTPQGFQRHILLAAHNSFLQGQGSTTPATDDTSLTESIGYSSHIIPGNSFNMKITTAEDYLLARQVMLIDWQKEPFLSDGNREKQ